MSIEPTDNIKKHLHHIIPRHMNGTNDPSNLVLLTILEHAEEHRKLWEEHGKKEDYIAWKCLSNRMSSEEARIEASKLGTKRFIESGEKYENYKKNISNALKGRKQSEESKNRKSKALKQTYKSGSRRNFFAEQDKDFFIKLYHSIPNLNEKMSEGRRKSKKWKDSVTSVEYKEKKTLADPRSKKIIVNGVTYNSIREASKKANVSYSKLRKNVLKGNDNIILF